MLSSFKDGRVADLQQLRAAGGTFTPRLKTDSHAPQCAHSSHQYPIIPQLWLTRLVTPSHSPPPKKKRKPPTGYKFRELKAEMRQSVGCGVLVCEALRSLCLCAVLCVLQGCPSALRLVWRRGSLWQANRDQLGSPAHKELRSRRL